MFQMILQKYKNYEIKPQIWLPVFNIFKLLDRLSQNIEIQGSVKEDYQEPDNSHIEPVSVNISAGEVFSRGKKVRAE